MCPRDSDAKRGALSDMKALEGMVADDVCDDGRDEVRVLACLSIACCRFSLYCVWGSGANTGVVVDTLAPS